MSSGQCAHFVATDLEVTTNLECDMGEITTLMNRLPGLLSPASVAIPTSKKSCIFLTTSNILAEFDGDEFDKIERIRGAMVDHDPLAAAEKPTRKNPFGFVLPSGISEKDIGDAVRNSQAHFDTMETFREIAEDPGQEVPLLVPILFGADRESLLDTNELKN